MGYVGRIFSTGRTERGSAFVAYGISGRSPASKDRKAVLYQDRIAIEPISEMTKEQREQADLIFYDAIRVDRTMPRAVVSNGKQTKDIWEGDYNFIEETPATMMLKELKKNGVETDKYHTPRIAGLVDNRIFTLGIITEYASCVGSSNLVVPGEKMSISTYSGESNEPTVPEFYNIEEVIRKSVGIKENSADELASFLYYDLDSDLRVCTAAAVWQNEKWEFAVRNQNP